MKQMSSFTAPPHDASHRAALDVVPRSL